MEIKYRPTLFTFFGYLVIALLGTVCNINSLNGDFVFDDVEVLVNNKDILPDTPVKNVFKNDYWGTNLKHNHSHKSYRPLTILSFRLNYYLLGKLDPFGFHVVNVALHVFISCMLWSVFICILGKKKEFISFLGAVLFSVHPIHSEAVSGIVGRADLLSALFFLSFLSFSKSNVNGVKEWLWLCLSISLATISMFCKEQGVTVIVLTYNYLFSLNFWLLLCPEWLCFDWSMGCIPLVTLIDFRVIFVLIFWFCFIYMLWKALFFTKSERQRHILISLSIMVIPFLPASNILFTVGFVIAERVLYIPSAGFCALVICGVEILTQNFPLNKNDLTFGFSLLVIVFLIRSYERSLNWKTEVSLFNSGALVCPLNAKVHYNIAKSAVDSGDLEKAVREYREAIRLLPDYDQALNNLANILKTKGEMAEAENLLRKALNVRREFPAAWMNLGIVLAQTKRFEEAEDCYRNALNFRKNYPDCYYNLGNLYVEQNFYEEAEKAWTVAIKLKPNFVMAWNNLIILVDNLGNLTRAKALAQEALNHLPKDPGIHFNLANILGKSGEYQQSEHHFLQALKLNPTNAQYYANLGVLYHRWKKYRNAMESYKKALKINPKLKSAKENFELLKKKMENID